MRTWKSKLVKLAIHLDDASDKLTLRLKRRLGANHPIQVVTYRTYGTPYRIYVQGRVLEDKKIAVGNDDDSLLTNIVNMYKRFGTAEVPGATVQLRLEDGDIRSTTNREGYFVFNLQPLTPFITKELYHTIPVHLVNAPYSYAPATATAEIMIPPDDAEYGIISDIDDTIIRTGVTNLLAMGKIVLLSNARTRMPFAGVSEFYKSLQLGRNGKRNNPFFYVSSSPWNLYDLLIDFMDHNEIPAGPLLLRDFGVQNESFMSGDSSGHKLKEISQILATYPLLNFVLVGDSGEKDPRIYYEIAQTFPGRIISIYIRDVHTDGPDAAAREIAEAARSIGVEMIFSKNTVEAAEHAAATGLIFTEDLPAIIEDKKEDLGQAPGKVEAEL